MYKFSKIQALIFSKWAELKEDTFGFKAKTERKWAEKTKEKKIENYKRDYITPLDERFQTLPEKRNWIVAFVKNYKSIAVETVDMFKKYSLKDKTIVVAAFGSLGIIIPGGWGAIAFPAAIVGVFSIADTYGKNSKTTWRNKLYKKQISFENKVKFHDDCKPNFNKKLVDLKAEFSRNIALACKHYEELAATQELNINQQEAFHVVRSVVTAQNINVSREAAKKEIVIAPIDLEKGSNSFNTVDNAEFSDQSFRVEAALNKFKIAWTKVKRTDPLNYNYAITKKISGIVQQIHDNAIKNKITDTAQQIEVLEQKFTEWNQKALIHEVKLYSQSIDIQNEVEKLMPSAKMGQDTIVSILKSHSEDVFEAAYLLGHMLEHPFILYDVFGGNTGVEVAEKSPGSLAEKFIVGSATKIDSLLESSNGKHAIMRSNDNVSDEIVEKSRAFVQRIL